MFLQLRVYRTGEAHGTRPAFEDGFELVVIRAPVKNFRVQVGSGVVHETIKEVGGQFRLQVAYHPHFNAVFVDQRGASAQIDLQPQRVFHP